MNAKMSKEKQQKYDNHYLKLAQTTSELSCAVRSKVGAILVQDNTIIADGFNGTPSGFDNTCEFADENGKLVTKPEVIHAEENAICKAARQGIATKNSTLYITLSPCYNCSKLLLASGIIRVVYAEEYRDKTPIEFLKKAGVKVEHFKQVKER